MSYAGLSETEWVALREASTDRLLYADRIERVLYVGEVVYRIGESGKAGIAYAPTITAEKDAPGVILDVSFSRPLPSGAEQQPCRLTYLVATERGEVEIEGFAGKVVRVKGGREPSLRAVTPGYYWSRRRMGGSGEGIEYVNAPANEVIFSAVSRLGYRGISIPASVVGSQTVTAVGSERIRPSDTVEDTVSLALADPPTYAVSDTATGDVNLYPLGQTYAKDVVWEIEEGVDCAYGSVVVETPEEERFASVDVVRQREDGSEETLASVAIDNGSMAVSGDVFLIEYSDEDEAAGLYPFEMAVTEARRRARDTCRVSAEVVYWPLGIERGDVVGMTSYELDVERDGRVGDIRRRYLVRLDDYTAGPDRAEGTVSGDGRLAGERFIPAKVREAQGRGGTLLMFGYGHDSVAYFDLANPWVELDPETGELVLDPSVASEYGVVIEEDGNYVEVSHG